MRAMRHLIEGVEGFQQQRFRDHRPVRRLPVLPVESFSTYARTNSAADAAVAGFLDVDLIRCPRFLITIMYINLREQVIMVYSTIFERYSHMITDEHWTNPTPLLALDLACVCVKKDDALAYWNKAVAAFREALGNESPRGEKANEICYTVLSYELDEIKKYRDRLNEKFSTKRTFHL